MTDYRIEPFAAQDAVAPEDVIALWTSEGALSPAEAQRRAAEVFLVATDPQDRLVAVSTAYLDVNAQLRARLWHVRIFIARAHREARLSHRLSLPGLEYLTARYVSGEDRRGIGVLYELENEILWHRRPWARLPNTGALFIGENAAGHPVHVSYFPGAPAPEPGPPQGSS